jgi:hypothetical protein
MGQYKLRVWGWEFDGSAHKLTNEEVENVKTFLKEHGYDTLSDAGWSLEEVLDNWSPHDTNWWSLSRPFFEDKTTFILTDMDGNEIWEAKVGELGDIYDLADANGIEVDGFDEQTTLTDAYPYEGQENILFYYETNKGTIGSLLLECDEVPQPKDFAVVGGNIETPENEIEYIDRVWFKNTELEWDYDDEFTNGKGMDIKLYTLDDVED